MTKVNNSAGAAPNRLIRIQEGQTKSPGMSSLYKNCNPMRELRRVNERAARKEQVRSAKVIQIKSTRGFA